jgi:hypothetical protein
MRGTALVDRYHCASRRRCLGIDKRLFSPTDTEAESCGYRSRLPTQMDCSSAPSR